MFDALFGPKRQDIWQEVAASLNGRFTPGSFLRSDNVRVQTENGIITLDLHTESSGQSSTTYTRLRAPFVNRLNQRLRIYRAGIFSELGKMLGSQDIEIGDPEFDREFMLQGSSPEWVRAVVDSAAVRLIRGHERFFLEIRPEQRLLGPRYPEGVEVLVFQVPEIIKDAARLRQLFQLVDHLLRRFETVGFRHLEPADRLIAILKGPGGLIVEDGDLVWNGSEPRCRAAAELGRMQEPRALHALVAALREPDPGLQHVAVSALGQLRQAEAIPVLIPLLGLEPRLSESSLAGRAARSLTMLGEKSLVDAFSSACAGALESPTAVERHLRGFAQAMIAVLGSSDPGLVRNAAGTLAMLGAVEALEPLRERRRKLDPRAEQTREAVDRAIQQLERLSKLPRPSTAPGADPSVLPRPADENPGVNLNELPLPSGSRPDFE